MKERHLRKRRQRTRLDAALAGGGGFGLHLFHLDRDRLHVEEPPGSVRGGVPASQRRLELDGPHELLARGLERLAVEGALARTFEGLGCGDAQVFRRASLELLAQRHRAVEVERADLEQLVADAFAQPLREGRVQLGAHRLAEPAVRDLADEHVLEAERALSGDRRAFLHGDELSVEQRLEQVGHVELRCERFDGSLPEHAADHRRALQELFLLGRQRVDARRDQRLNRVGNALAVGAALREHPDRLLEEERVALRLLEHHRPLRLGKPALRQQSVGELLALVRIERRELDRDGA